MNTAATIEQKVITIEEPPQTQEIIEQKNLEIHNQDVVQEIHEQTIYEIQRVPTTQFVEKEPIVQHTVAPVVEEIVGDQIHQLEYAAAPPSPTVEHVSSVKTIQEEEEIKNVIHEIHIERHLQPMITEVIEQKIIQNVEQPIMRKIVHPTIVRDSEPIQKPRKTVSFDKNEPIVLNEEEISRNEQKEENPTLKDTQLEKINVAATAPGAAKTLPQKPAQPTPQRWFIAHNASTVLLILLAVAALSVGLKLWQAPNHYMTRAMVSGYSLKELIRPSYVIPGEENLSARARAFNRVMAMNMAKIETLEDHRKNPLDMLAPPLNPRYIGETIANGSLLLRDVVCIDKPNVEKLAIIYLHAGGFVSGGPKEGQFIYNKIREGSSKCVDMLSVKYRLAPEHKLHEIIDDAVNSFKYLEAQGYRNISVMGSSAGGGLALTLAHELKEDQRAHLHSLVLFSPFIDYTRSTNSHYENAKYDILFTDAVDKLIKESLRHTPRELEVLSPYFKLDQINYPKTFLYYSPTERCADQDAKLAEALGSKGTVRTVPGLPHIAPVFNSFVQESSTIMDDVVQFLK
jgi:monoterpene epsilon-lactone hydrolase